MSQKRYKILVKDDQRKDVRATMFQYEEVMGLIETNRYQLGKASDPDNVTDFRNLKKIVRSIFTGCGPLVNYYPAILRNSLDIPESIISRLNYHIFRRNDFLA